MKQLAKMVLEYSHKCIVRFESVTQSFKIVLLHSGLVLSVYISLINILLFVYVCCRSVSVEKLAPCFTDPYDTAKNLASFFKR